MAGRNEIEILIRARDEASRTVDSLNRKIVSIGGTADSASASMDGATRSSNSLSQSILGTAAGFVTAQAAIMAATGAFHAFTGAISRGIESIDRLKTSQAALAASFATSDPSLGFEKAYAIAGGMVEKIQEMDRAFVGTADELTLLVQSMALFGAGIDISNQKAQDQFVAFANLLKLLTTGQDFQRQVFQEIRSLMEGVNVPGAALVKLLEAQGVNTKKMIPLWREQGTLITEIISHLGGYEEASKKIEQTLAAQRSSLSTIVDKILRGAMAPAYEYVRDKVKEINDALFNQQGLTDDGRLAVEILQEQWEKVKGVLEGINSVIRVMIELTKGGRTWTEDIGKRFLTWTDWIQTRLGGYPGGRLPRGIGDIYPFPDQYLTDERGVPIKTFPMVTDEDQMVDEILITKGTGAGESDEAKKERERREKERQKEAEKIRKWVQETAEEYDKGLIYGAAAIDKYLNEQLKKRLDDEKNFAEKSEKEIAEARLAIIKEENQKIVDYYQNLAGIQFAAVGDLLAGFNQKLGDTIFDALSGRFKKLSDIIQDFTDVIRNAWANLISDIITESLRLKFEKQLKSGIGDFIGAFLPGLGGLSTAQFSELSALTPGLEAFYGYRHGGVMPGSFIPIRAFAGGGIADSPTFGLIAEAGEKEAVVPLRGGKIPVDLGGSPSTNINFQIVAADTSDFDRLLEDRRGMIVGMIADGLRSGSHFRDMIKRNV